MHTAAKNDTNHEHTEFYQSKWVTYKEWFIFQHHRSRSEVGYTASVSDVNRLNKSQNYKDNEKNLVQVRQYFLSMSLISLLYSTWIFTS